MKTLGDALYDLLKDMEILEPETLDIKDKIGNLTSSDVLQIDSVIKLGKLNGSKTKGRADKAKSGK